VVLASRLPIQTTAKREAPLLNDVCCEGIGDMKNLVCILIAVLVLLLLSACSSGGGRRGRVSDKADQAAHREDPGRGTGSTRTKEDHKQQADENHDTDEDDDEGSFLINLLIGIFRGGDDDRDETQPQAPPRNTAPHANSAPHDWEFSERPITGKNLQSAHTSAGDSTTGLSHHALMVWLSRANPTGDAISRISSISVLYSASTARGFRGHIGVYYGDNRRGPQEVVQQGISEIREFGVDLGARSYLRPNADLGGFYLLYGIRGGAMRWKYAWSEPSPGNLPSDGVLVFTPYLGIGTSVLQAGPVQLGASLSWGPRIMFSDTFEKYENDLFPSVGELRCNLETSVRF